MKKQFFAILISVFLVNALFSITVSPIIENETSFFAIPDGETIETYRPFHGEIFENGNNEAQNVAVGSGDFSTYSSAYDLDPNWLVNTKYDFTLSHDSAGNVNFIVHNIGMAEPLSYQPLIATNQIFIGNDNDSGISFHGMEMTDMVFSSGTDFLVLPDLVTTGDTFKGLVVSDFADTWNLSGIIEFTTPEGGTLAHFSSFKFYGAVPEPSAYPLLLGLYAILLVISSRKR